MLERNETAELRREALGLKAANRDLAQRNARLKSLVDAEPECVHLMSADGGMLEMNQASLRLFGARSFAELETTSMLSHVVEEHRDAFRDLLAKVMGGSTTTLDFEAFRRDGGRRWLSTTGSPVRDATGSIVAVVGVTRDVTDRKRTEVALRETEARFQTICEASPVGIFFVRADGYVTYGNPANMRMTGLSPEKNNGTNWIEAVHPDERAHVLADWQASQAVGRPYKGSGRFLHPDGTILWWEVSTAPVYDGPTLIGFAGMMVDITERKEAEAELRLREARFRALIEGATDLIGVLDTTGAVVYTSPSCQRVLGYEAEEFAGRAAVSYICPEDVPTFEAAVQRARRAPHTVEPCLFRVRHADNSWRRLDACIRSMPEQSPDGFLVVNARDVTDRHTLEQQLAQAQKLQAIGTLAGGIAHDFNNILAVVLGNAELLRHELAPGDSAMESIDEILHASQRARELVQRILLFSRPHDHELRPIRLEPVIEEAAKMLRSTLPACVELVIHVEPGLPVVRADALQIDQIIFNLATNAWHAMGGDGGRIDVHVDACRVDGSLRAAAPELTSGPYVRLSVRDNGRGMDAATVARIFEPFFTTKAPGQGTGLGLSVVHGIVRSHGGSILVDSQPGRGTTFDVYLPARPEETELPLPEMPPEAELRGNGEHILYVDDEESLVLHAVRFFTRLGYRVTGKTRAADAIDAFRADPSGFDVVITDFNMPGMSGLDVARQVIDLNHDACVVLVTGFLPSPDGERARALGIREVVLKPNTVEALGPLVHRLLHEGRAAVAEPTAAQAASAMSESFPRG